MVGEIPGATKKDELVMLGAHLDSWTGATGATDNGAGSAVVLEAMRILKALDLKLPRTVRMALWTGEEEGLLGSHAYVKEHFADRETMALKPEHSKLSGYFNLDNGTGKIRGAYLQGNDMMRPIFQAWLEPFKDYGAATVTIPNTGGTDHQSFDAVGLPGFQFIQDPMVYSSETHHSTADTYDHLQAGDLMEASAIMAAVAYDAATRDEMLPRKPLPKPQPTAASEGEAGPVRAGAATERLKPPPTRLASALQQKRPGAIKAPGRGAPVGCSEVTTRRGGGDRYLSQQTAVSQAADFPA